MKHKYDNLVIRSSSSLCKLGAVRSASLKLHDATVSTDMEHHAKRGFRAFRKAQALSLGQAGLERSLREPTLGYWISEIGPIYASVRTVCIAPSM